MFRLLSLIMVCTVVAAVAAQEGGKPPAEKNEAEMEQPVETQPHEARVEAVTEPGLYPRVKLETTLGDIVLELNGQKAPVTVQNFIRYAEEGFYDGTIFHRVVSDFVIQGGGLTAERRPKREGLHPPIQNEWQNGLKNKVGTIAMARGPKPDSARSQFFINVSDNDKLDGPLVGGAGYTVFGKVVEGMDAVDEIKSLEVRIAPEAQRRYEQQMAQGRRAPPPEKSQPVEPPVIKSVKLVSAYDREKVQAQVEAAEQAAREAKERARAAKEKELQDLIAKTEEETGKKVQKTESGLMYAVLTEGEGPSPKPTDMVQVHYTGWLTNGVKFDSSHDRGQPTTFKVTGVIKGWTEALGMMKVGGKWKLIIPSELAYGKRGMPPKIPPGAMLVFEVELLGIQ